MIALALSLHSARGQNLNGAAACSDSLFSSSPACRQLQQQDVDANSSQPYRAWQSGTSTQTTEATGAQGQASNAQVYVDSAGSKRQYRTAFANANSDQNTFPPDPLSDLQKLTISSTGETIPIFGRDLFERVPSTFAPADEIPASLDYVIGPGDEILVRLWGAEATSSNSQLTVDASGNIYIPRVGSVNVAGLRSSDLQEHISAEIGQLYRNFRVSVSIGHLRSIQIYVVGEARRPGAYTVSALSTVLNALLSSGGPNVQGSMRRIQVRRSGQTLSDFDLYDLVLRGDKTRDVRLESGDTIFIPPVGPQIAIAGSVRHPAIYELKDTSTLDDVLKLAGGFSATGAPEQIRLERIAPDLQRRATVVILDVAGRALPLHDGDVLYADHISSSYQQSVTIRGNLANPGRFAWKTGMRLTDIIPERGSLLTPNYWRERNRLGVPIPLFEPSNSEKPSKHMDSAAQQVSQRAANGQNTAHDALSAVQPPDTGEAGQKNAGLAVGGVVSTADEDISTSGSATNDRNLIRIPAPEIDWSYAVVEHLDTRTLRSTLIPFNLGKLVLDHDPSQNIELQPGDVVTILSQKDITVPQDDQTKYIRLEGEFVGAGVYSVVPGETLDQLVRRAGGFTPRAYLYGSSFQRESARVFQQQRLNEYISELSANMERQIAVRGVSSPTGVSDPNAFLGERGLVSQLRQLRATGRVVLEFLPDATGTGVIPPIPLENGDIFRVPPTPNTVSVIGAVYGQNLFLYNSNRRLSDYIALAGKTNRIADKSHAYIIRADGSIYSRERAKGALSNHFNEAHIYPGDAIVVPEKLIKPSALKQLTDYSQILSSFGLAAAAINVVR